MGLAPHPYTPDFTYSTPGGIPTYSMGPIGGAVAQVTGNRNIILHGGAGTVSIRGGAGGWVTGTEFRGNNETVLGYFGTAGNASTLDKFFVGAAYNNSIVDFYQAHPTLSNKVTAFNGLLQIPVGLWHRSSEATPKQRILFATDATSYYQGHGTFPHIFRNGSEADIVTFRGTGTSQFNGPMFVGAGSSSDGRRLLSANYDGSVEGHFISGLVSERSTSAIGFSWGMYQDNASTWLSGWNYASLRRTALLLDHGSLRFIASPSATTASPGAALPSQPATVFYVDTLGQVVTNGSVTCRYGVHIADLDGANAGVSQWLTYKISGVGQPLNFRDMVNSRQQMQFYPGATAAASLVYMDSKVQSSDSVKIGYKTIATLPSAASSTGERYQLSDSATVVNRIAFSNGTAWYYEGTAVAV